LHEHGECSPTATFVGIARATLAKRKMVWRKSILVIMFGCGACECEELVGVKGFSRCRAFWIGRTLILKELVGMKRGVQVGWFE
jgi:hypothetical protein